MTPWRECATKKTMHWVVTTWTTGQNNWLSDNTTFAAKFARQPGVASNNFGVMSAEQLAKQLSQVTETKTWQTSQEMAGQIG